MIPAMGYQQSREYNFIVLERPEKAEMGFSLGTPSAVTGKTVEAVFSLAGSEEGSDCPFPSSYLTF